MSLMRPWNLSRFTRFPLMAVLAFAIAAPASLAFAQDDDEAEEADDQPVQEEEFAEGEIADTDASAVVVFRDRLSPYGSWVETNGHGLVWVPASHVVGSDFSPYVSSGHWELTDGGDWLWSSDYEWGAIPFHYGRWVWAGDLGWAWVPGRVYAPAWVTWRTGADGYIGWAPLPPWYYWSGGIAYYHHHHFHAAYSFVPTVHVFHHHVHTQVYRDKADVSRAAKSTRPYHEANPTKGSVRKPAAPSLDEAGVKSADAPKTRSKGDAKALAFSKPDAIKKSKESSAKMKSASPDNKRSNAIGFAAPSVQTQRAKFEASRPKPSPSKQAGTFEGRSGKSAAESRRSDSRSPRTEGRSSRSRDKGSFEANPSSRSSGTPDTRTPRAGSSSRRSAPSADPSTSTGSPKASRSKRTNSGSSTESSTPSRSHSVDSPSRSSAPSGPSTSSGPSRSAPKAAPKSAPSSKGGRGGRRGR